MTQKIAIFYGRVSDPKQAEKELPIASQLESCRKKAAQLEAVIVKEFLDEGISGRRDNRPAFQDAIMFAEIEQPDYFIIWSSSRFARNKLDAAFYKKKLEIAGVQLVYVSVEIDTSTNEGWLLDGVFELFDELTSRQISSDTRRSLLKNARDGFWNGGRLPFGFSVISDIEKPKRKRLIANPDEVPVVQKIFEMKAHHALGSRSIAFLLNRDGFLNRGTPWVKSTVAHLLRNEAVIGKTVFGRRDSNKQIRKKDQWIIVDSHAPLIDLELWNVVQQKLDHESDPINHGSPHSHHYFTGLLKCGECGASLHTESAKGRSKRYWYYNCSAAKAGLHAPRRLPADIFDDFMIDVLCEQIFHPDTLKSIISELMTVIDQWHGERAKRRSAVINRLRAMRQAQNNLYSVLEAMGVNAPNLGDISARLRSNNEQIRAAEAELQAIEHERQPECAVNVGDLSDLSKILNDVVREADVKTARNFFATIVNRIVLMPDHIKLEYRPERLVNRPIQPVPSKEIWLPDTSILGTKVVKLNLPKKLGKIAV